MEGIAAVSVLIGFGALIVGAVWLIVPKFRRSQPVRIPVAVLVGGVVLFIIGVAITPTEESSPSEDVPATAMLTPESTATAAPASPPTATAMPTPRPTATAAPTLRPTATPSPIIGLGVTRHEIQSIYESPVVGFMFESPDFLNTGEPRILGQSQGGAIIELIGPPNNLTVATMTVFLPHDATETVIRDSAYYLQGLVWNVLPEWKDGLSWVSNGLGRLVHGPVSTQLNHARVELSLSDWGTFASISLTIKAQR